ncbi:MAG: TonB-dependent receptor plug domain-containing protein, partial [Dysgonamonadaceae bacterium]
MGQKSKKDRKATLVLMMSMLMTVLAIAQTSQTIDVRGTVKDTNGEPIIGANILLQGTSIGTITDFEGNFSIQAPPNGVLEIRYVGYKTQIIPINNRTSIQIILEEDVELLEEVVVIGYGTVRKDDATGSVTAIKPEELNKGLTVNAQDMITGKIAGVVVTPNDGTPGGGATIRIRGGSSLNASNDPLIIVDGLALDNNGIKGVANFLSTINPNDIESFTVLKDASATAIYGSRASNGVILIQTKKGVAGMKPRISYNGNFNISTIRD